ncbi:MAG: pyridoxamine 5'-phosphate oxidase family protein [Gammaproteobacteria bacterium]|nr:pyridoxamine 5'-phosphate oxidase family protein [Gammaproteobacteria bacterium]
MGTIETEAALRSVIGEEIPGLSKKNEPFLNEFAIEFIAKAPFLVLSTADDQGRLDASPKGDAPGFVAVEDAHTLLIPDRLGNRLAYGHRNILVNPHVGVLFMIPGTTETLRVNGKASLTADPDLLQRLAVRGRPAVLVIRVEVEEVFFHCSKAFLRSKLWQPDVWGERHKVSFGKLYAKRNNASEETAAAIDEAIERDYRENL